MKPFTQEQYDMAMELLKSLYFDEWAAVQLLMLANEFGATLETVNEKAKQL